ncbi:YraN family protein [Intestinibacillus massiliensis]|nr:YraN family protein [Intestinibacillus massiliensis]
MRARGETGRRGEEAAAAYLGRRGYTVLARNFRVREGEIDLVAQRDGVLAFVEVKTRADSRFAEAREFVTPQKQRRLLLAATQYLAAHPCALQPRFDVAEVYWPAGAAEPSEIRYWENAFEA